MKPATAVILLIAAVLSVGRLVDARIIKEIPCELDREEWQEATADLRKILAETPEPPASATKMPGVRFVSVRDGSIFRKIGMMNDDVLLKVNDQAIDSMHRTLAAFTALEMQKSFDIELRREEKRKTIHCKVR